jgi:hypothetical protein
VDVPAAVVVYSGSMASNHVDLSYDTAVVFSVSPTVFDAVRLSGERPRLTLSGVNFGVFRADTRSFHSVYIGGVPCFSVVWVSDSQLVCVFDAVVAAGWYNVSVGVLGDVGEPSGNMTVRAVCPAGMFGLSGEACRSCPIGGVCEGGDTDPAPIRGFYALARGSFVACSPREACVGGRNNTCHPNYEGVRCAQCRAGSYRYVLRAGSE